MNLKLLFLLHGIITLAAAVVLIVAPALIPATVAIPVTPDQYLLCYFLGAAEGAIAFLSFESRKIKDAAALRMVSAGFIVFHAATGLLEAFALTQGLSPKILVNIALRVGIAGLFYAYGIRKKPAAAMR